MLKKFSWIGLLAPIIISAQLPSKRARPVRAVDSLQLPVPAPAEVENTPVSSSQNDTEEESDEMYYPSLLQSARDPFITTAMYDWGAARFAWRGYIRERAEHRINGALIGFPITGQVPWYIMNGMNSQIRMSQSALGIAPIEYSLGNLAGSRMFDGTNSLSQQQTAISVGYADNRHTLRFNLAHSSGMPVKGWAWSTYFQYATNKATNAYPGMLTSFSGLIATEKKYRNSQRLYAMFCFAPQVISKQSPITRELFQISGNFRYNSNWGFQDNQIRFAATRTYQFPALFITHEYSANQHTVRKWSLAAISGYQGDQGLDWYQVADPRPDYYRYMPSYSADSLLQQRVTDLFQQKPERLQINWQQLYATNLKSRDNGIAASLPAGLVNSGYRSRYIVEERRTNTRLISLNYYYHTLVRKVVDFSAGASWQLSENRYRKKVVDLLGGDYYLNINGFADAQLQDNVLANQYNIAEPNPTIYKGDYFGYDYGFRQTHTEFWCQWQENSKRVDWFVAGRWGVDRLMRKGYVANGLFPLNSFGNSLPITTQAYLAKGGITRKLNGNHFLFAQAAFQSRGPLAAAIFIHPRYSAFTRNDITAEKTFHIEAGWVFRSPSMSSRLSLFTTQTNQAQEIQSFYNDAAATWVNHVVSGLGFLQRGVEWSGSVQWNVDWNIDWAACVYQLLYRGQPTGKLYADNTESLLSSEPLWINGYRLGGTPQQALHIGLRYQTSEGWMASVSINQLSNHWVSLHYLRRTSSVLASVDPASPLRQTWMEQEKLPDVLSIHALFGYSFRLASFHKQKAPVIRIFLSARNFPTRYFIAGGYEQARWDVNADGQIRFPNKYFFSPGSYFTSSFQISF